MRTLQSEYPDMHCIMGKHTKKDKITCASITENKSLKSIAENYQLINMHQNNQLLHPIH